MRYIVVGGGIAGVSCVFSLLREAKADDKVVLVSASEHVKTVSNWIRVGQFAEFFTVSETQLFVEDSRFTLIKGIVTKWNSSTKVLKLADGTLVEYDSLCIATGATPKCPWNDSRVLVLRDSDSAMKLQSLLSSVKHVVLVGNGGISTELAYELRNVHISWVIRDEYPASVFLIPQASRFVERRLISGRTEGSKTASISKRHVFSVECNTSKGQGCALGPDWNTSVLLEGAAEGHTIDFYTSDSVAGINFNTQALSVSLSSGTLLQCDLVICATGVDPCSAMWKEFCAELVLAEDGGIRVDEQMRTSVPDVFACGDVCSVNWPSIPSSWKQMRLWSQARQMGDYCARSMCSGSQIELDFCFEMFAHVTTFCGFKIVLLGDYRGERCSDGWYVRERVVGDNEYVCCVILDHRVIGATLIGETQLDETIENLILNRTDISQIEEHFLDPGVDIEDYFD